jgi:PAS domain S-box-containing protein
MEELEYIERIAHIGSWRWDVVNDRLISCSPEYARIHGVSMDNIHRHLDNQMAEIIHPDDVERIKHVFKTSDDENKRYEVEYRIFLPNGEMRYVVECGEPVKNDGSQVLEQWGTVQDITERKLTEQALRKNRSQLQSILDFSPVTISVKDMAGDYLLVNKRQQDLFNIPIEDMEGANTKKVLPESLLKSALAQEKELLETMQPSVREHQFHVDDQYFTMLTSKFLIMDDEQKPTGIGTMAMDITELKQAEAALEKSRQELRDSEASFRAVVEQAGDAFFLIDTKTARFKQVNNQACKALGYSHEELITLSVPDVDRAFPIEKFTNLIESLAMGDTVTIETTLIRKDATIFPAEIRTGLVETNAETYLLALVRDVTERKQAEAELRVLQRDLIRNERLATLGQLTATVSHELRNPLGAMRPSLYLLQKRLPTDDERLIAAFERLDRNIDRCDQIIDQMLDFTRIQGIDRQTLELDAWITEELKEMEIPDGIDVKCELGLTNREFSFDPERLRRALINVYDNACQAMLEDSALATESIDGQLLIKTRANDQRIEIVVSDTGPGIPEDVLPRIFEPLYSTRGFGVGLGLATVQQALQQHDGDIEVLTGEGRGTSMVLWLPLLGESGVAA